MAEEEKKSRVLVIGATGRMGQELVKASLVAGHPTLAVARESAFSVPHKASLLRSFVDSGVTVLKRFIPSEFGADPDKVQILDMDMGFYKKKAEIRRLIESEGIPHTYISCNFFMTYLLPSLVQPGSKIPPRDKVKIYGNGNSKAVFVKESDVAAFTISSIDDPRTLNKVLYLRPPGNVVSMNDLVDLWEMKITKNLQKDYIPEEKLLKNIQDMPYPDNMELVFIYSAFIKGDHTYFNIDEAGVDAIRLYPNVKYTTVSQFLDTLL
ncbi:probable pinoresinol-lariciresinol reductase 3 isoform X2 [Dendrobium catenatum]|uniref:probable pinoresinol-lariciresinol reductase 3 isoform X2 n=1 Tax=Dendrobium catenatum TaxID=906689 RepID=UPI0009F4A95E|nr:probable pinoresinol-lariciresinol reductase 3 isoform X2 [Dendrobium catenatum]